MLTRGSYLFTDWLDIILGDPILLLKGSFLDSKLDVSLSDDPYDKFSISILLSF